MASIYDLFDKTPETTAAPPAATADVFATSHAGAPPRAYVKAGVAGQLLTLDRMRAATTTMAAYRGDPWDTTTWQVACELIKLANVGAGYTIAQAESDLMAHAPTDPGFGPRQHEAKWKSARDHVGNQARVIPDRPDIVVRVAPSEMSLAGGDGRRLVVTRASDIAPRRVRWLWHQRMATGSFGLLGGREGVGKSTYAYDIAARITRGQLDGEHHGEPRAVLIAATEDSWAHTIVPRLMAAGADLDRIYQVEVVGAEDVHVGLSLPRDVARVEDVARQYGAVLLLLDPLMSRIDSGLDAHKDPELRQALEPLAALADRTGLHVLGLIHFNKSGTSDVLDRIMGSRAFVAVARTVSVVVSDPDDDDGRRRLFSTPKNNLGRGDLPSLAFTVEDTAIPTDDGAAHVGRIVSHGESATTAREAMERASEDPEVRTATGDAAEWLREYLEEHGGLAGSRELKRDGKSAGHHEQALRRAGKRMKVAIANVPGVSPRSTTWALPAQPTTASDQANRVNSPRGGVLTDTTNINAGQSVLGVEGDTTSRVNGVSGDKPPRARDTNGFGPNVGPCITAGCGQRIERYGDNGRPFCDDCAANVGTL